MKSSRPPFWTASFLPALGKAFLLFFIALLPRLTAIGQYITPDELNWVHRSVLFHQALGQGNWPGTLTTGHPGVITTWLGALGLQVQLWIRPFDWAAYEWITHLAWLAPENTAAFPQLAVFLTAGRMAVALANSFGLLVIYWLAQQLVRREIALAFVLLLAVDPFVAGLSGLLHVDGLMTSFVTISLLALAVGLSKKYLHQWRMMILSGAAAGCAILAKSAALTLLPFVVIVFLFSLLRRPKDWFWHLQIGLIWLAAAALIQFLLLPALWESPISVYRSIIGTIFHEAEEVLPNTFFLGQYSQAHGPEFYAVALLYRLNPLVFVGLLLAGLLGFRAKKPANFGPRPFHWLPLGWPVFFVVVLAMATKKFDRYLLPALPSLFLLGALGWGSLLQWRPFWRRIIQTAGVGTALVYLGTAVPYLLNAYNPIPALFWPTQDVLPLGWGEAVSASARWLAEHPGAAGKTAVAGIGPAFAPFFPGTTLLSDGQNWKEADYIVETVAGYQSQGLVPNLDRAGQSLLHTVHFDGLDQAWIFTNAQPEKSVIDWQQQSAAFGEQIRLLAAALTAQGDELAVYGRWQLAQPTSKQFNVQIRLLDESGNIWTQLDMPLLNEVYFYPENWRVEDQPVWRYLLKLPPGMPPGRYQVGIALFEAGSGSKLPVLLDDGRFAGVDLKLEDLALSPPAMFQAERLGLGGIPSLLLDGDLLQLEQVNLQPEVLTGETIPFDLFWQTTAVLPSGLQVKFSANEETLAVLPLSRFDTAQWQPGQIIREKYLLSVPADLAEGEYQFNLEVVDAAGQPLGPSGLQLGQVSVVSPDRLFTLPPDIAMPLALEFADITTLRGYELLTPVIAPGETVHLLLYWQVDRPSAEIISTFLHLVGPDGRIEAQGDRWPGGLPSTFWAEGQVILDEYAIPLPVDAPVGNYQIVLGLYTPTDGQRLPVSSAINTHLTGDHFTLPQPLEVLGQ